MRTSPVIQSSQEAIAALHEAAAYWGRVFTPEVSTRAQLDGSADAIAEVFAAFQLAYSALPRFRTEPALRRFTDAMNQLARTLRALHLTTGSVLESAAAAAEQGAEHAQAAFVALGGKPAGETKSAPKPVQGTVQRLLADRGYGFVRSEDSPADIFFNAQALQGASFTTLRVGQAVRFRIIPDPRVPGRMQAIEVQPVR